MPASQQAVRVREYETVYVLRPTTSPQSAQQIASRVEEVMGKGGGRLTLVESWGRRQLAYPVQKHTRGVYVYLKFTGGGVLVSELERNFRMLDDVLKFQTVKVGHDLDPSSIEVDEAAVKFEALGPVEEEEPEETLEQQLGLEEPPPGEAGARGRGDRDDAPDSENGGRSPSDDDRGDSDESEEEEEEL